MARKFLGSVWPRIARVQVLHVALLHALQAQRQIAPGQMLDDAVKPAPHLGVRARCAHDCEPLDVSEYFELWSGGLEERQIREVLCRRRVGIKPVDKTHSINHTA